MYYSVIGAFLFGVAVRTVADVDVATIVWVSLLAFGVAVVARRSSFATSTRNLTILSLCLLAISLGLLRTDIHAQRIVTDELTHALDSEITITGIVAEDPVASERTQRFYIKSEEQKILVTTDRLIPVSYGDTVEVTGKLTKPEAFETELGRTFQYQEYLLAKGVQYTVSFVEVTVIEPADFSFIGFLLKQKHALMNGIESVIPEPQAGLGEGLLLGVKQALGTSLENDFRTTGIIHIVVLSGYNVMLVVAFVMYLLNFLLSQKKRVIFGVLAIACFALIVGLSPTVVRASIMATILLFAQAYGKNYNVLRALFLAGGIMVCINPYLLLYDIGFQLSFMATLGLILIAPQFELLAGRVPSKLGIKDFLFATIATQIAVLPLLLYHIGEISLIAVLVNVLVLPVVPFAMLATFLSGVFALASVTAGSVIGFLAYLSLQYIIIVAETFADVPFASVAVPAFSVWWVPGLYLVPLGMYFWFTNRKKQQTDFSDWEIHEEVDIIKNTTQTRVASSETPIFFR